MTHVPIATVDASIPDCPSGRVCMCELLDCGKRIVALDALAAIESCRIGAVIQKNGVSFLLHRVFIMLRQCVSEQILNAHQRRVYVERTESRTTRMRDGRMSLRRRCVRRRRAGGTLVLQSSLRSGTRLRSSRMRLLGHSRRESRNGCESRFDPRLADQAGPQDESWTSGRSQPREGKSGYAASARSAMNHERHREDLANCVHARACCA